jgi:hypothetical protein
VKAIVVSILLFPFVCVYAQTPLISGGSIRYEHLQNHAYKVIATLNRACEGEPLIDLPVIQVFSENNSFSLNCNRVGIKNISNQCELNQPCNIQNAISNSGIEQHTYEAEVDFNTAPFSVFKNSSNCRVYFGLNASKRSDSITNITKGDFYVEAMINLCLLKENEFNNSPQSLLNKNLHQQLNSPFNFYYDAIDLIDVDSLSFELISSKNSHVLNETYTGNLSHKTPVTPYCPPGFTTICPGLKFPSRGFYFDSAFGEIFVTPTRKEIDVVCMKINEYRIVNGIRQLIGFYSDEFVIVIKDHKENNSPYFVGSTQYQVCEGDSISFVITSSDDPKLPGQITMDTTSLAWNYLPEGSSISLINPNARVRDYLFQWQTKKGDGKLFPYNITFQLKDNSCPINGFAFRNFQILVKKYLDFNRRYVINDNNLLIFEPQTQNLDNRYYWRIKDANDSIIMISYKSIDSISLIKSGNYFIEVNAYNLKELCPIRYFDTINIKYDLNQFNLNNNHKIYPNPTHSVLNIETNKPYTSFEIYDIMGQLVLSKKIMNSNLTIDISNFENGVYSIRILGDGFIYNSKFTKL